MKNEILRMENVITDDEEMTNLNNFNIHIFQGEIMGLIGVNTQGKEKLLQLLCQNSFIKFGRIYIAEKLVNSYKCSDNSRNRVYVLGQASKLINNLTVADNVFVLKKGFKKYIVNRTVLNNQLNILLKEMELNIHPEEICFNLTEYQRCIVEILKAVVQGVKLLIVNDISNVLSANDFMKFKKSLYDIASKGYSVLYIGNHHEEVFVFCDRVALMKEGKILKIFNKKEMNNEHILPFLLPFNDIRKRCETIYNNQMLCFRNFKVGCLRNLSFQMNKGECVVIYDRSNKVQKDMIECLNGELILEEGFIEIGGNLIGKKEIVHKLGYDIAIIQEDATESMVFYDMNYIDNLCFLLDHKIHSNCISNNIKKNIQKEYSEKFGEEVYYTNVKELDKKSLYNLIYGRIHLLSPKLVFIAQPFSNADMYVRGHIIHLIQWLKRKGISVIILAVSLSDSLIVADKLILLEEGTIKKEYLPSDFGSIEFSI